LIWLEKHCYNDQAVSQKHFEFGFDRDKKAPAIRRGQKSLLDELCLEITLLVASLEISLGG
jgi:hypothetical protein